MEDDELNLIHVIAALRGLAQMEPCAQRIPRVARAGTRIAREQPGR